MSFKSYWSFPLAAFFLLAFLFAYRQNVDFDMGYHLKTGEWILQHGSFPQKDRFTFTANGNDYVDLHWLYQVACYLLYRCGGYFLIGLVHLILILAAFGLTYTRMRMTHAPPWVYPVLFLPALIAMELRFLDRPEVVSWILLILTLLVLDLRWTHKGNFLYLLPLFQLLWVNIEGLFILGWAAMGAYLASGWFQDRRLDRPLLKYSFLSIAVTLFNPYFLKGVAFPLVLFTRLQSSNIFNRYISEFQSPWLVVPNPSLPFMPVWPIYTYRIFSLLLLTVIALAFQKRKLHEFFLVAAFFGLSAMAIRNVPFFFWVTLPVAAASMRDLVASRPFLQVKSQWLSSNRLLPFLLALCTLLAGARVLSRAYYVSDHRNIHSGLGMDPEFFPIQAADFMAQNKLDAPLLNDLSYGGWLIWKGPGPVFIDGRLEVMGESIFTEYRDSFYPGGLPKLFLTRGVQIALVNPMTDIPWTTQLMGMPGWRLLYFDAQDALYARSDYRPDLATTSWESLLAQWGLTTPPPDSILTDLAKEGVNPLADWIGGFFTPRDYPMPLFRLGAFAYENGRFDAARSFFLEALRRSEGKYFEIYFNLGATYDRLHRPDLAALCYQKTLELNPNYAPARQKLEKSRQPF